MNELNYISNIELINIHEKVLLISGGLPGIKDYGQLESVTIHIQNDLYYPTIEEKLTHLIFAVVQFHMFTDGNKRTSIAVASEFLIRNDLSYLVSQFIQEMENVVVMVADSKIDEEFLKDIVTCILHYGELSEEIKWKIITLQ